MTKALLLKTSVYDHPSLPSKGESAVADHAVPLLENEATLIVASGENDDWMDSQTVQSRDLKLYSIMFGLIVGIGMVLSDLGARIIILVPGIRNEHLDLEALLTKREVTIFSLAWSIVLAISVVGILQLFVWIVKTSYSMRRRNNEPSFPEKFLFGLEARFFLGVLTGSFLSSVVVDGCLMGVKGLQGVVLYNVGCVLVSLWPLALYKMATLLRCERSSAMTQQQEGEDEEAELLVA